MNWKTLLNNETFFKVRELQSFSGKYQRFRVEKSENSTIALIKNTSSLATKILHSFLSNTWLPFQFTLFFSRTETIIFKKGRNPINQTIQVFKNNELRAEIIPQAGYNTYSFDIFNEKHVLLATVKGNGKNFEIKIARSKSIISIVRTNRHLLARVFLPKIEYEVQLSKFSEKGSDAELLLSIASVLPILIRELYS